MSIIDESQLTACAADLAARIDPEDEARVRQAWQAFYEGRVETESFTPPCRRPAPAGIDWPEVHINDALEDVDAMVMFELANCSKMLASGGGGLMNIRCNYGTGILPTLFGCELYVMPRETHTLPTARPLGRSEAMDPLLEAGPPDLETGLGARVFATAGKMLEVLSSHDALRDWVALYHPDLQGPIDVLEVVWGSEIFYAFCDEPEKVHAMLKLVTDTYAAFMRRWEAMVPPPTDGYTNHWSMLVKGRLMIRNDSLMNLSPDIYVDFVRDCDQRLFDEFGGGAIHYCGRGDHFLPAMSEMRGLTAINLSQPHLNDMEAIYANTVDKDIRIIGLNPQEIARARAAGRPLRGRVC